MAEHGSRPRPAGRADDPDVAGRPSPRATERLETQFAAELGLTRAAWDDALRRSDERWRRDDAAGAVEALEDQRRLLQLLEDRLRSVVSSAAVEREAERVVAAGRDASSSDVSAAEVSRPAAAGTEDAPEAEAPASRVAALAGAGAAVALTVVALALGVALGIGTPPVPEVAAPADDAELTPSPSSGGDVDHVVAIAEHYAVSAPDLSATSTNWHQVLRALDLAATTDRPAEEPSDGAGGTDEAAGDERTGDPDAGAAGRADDPDAAETSREPGPREDRDAAEAADAGRGVGHADDEGADDEGADRGEDSGLGELGDLDQDEETSLPGIEVPGSGGEPEERDLP